MFSVPQNAGKYKVVYRLQAPEAGKFGAAMKTVVNRFLVFVFVYLQVYVLHFFFCEIIVESSEEPKPEIIAEPEPSAPVEEGSFQYQEELATLVNMGFEQEQCKSVLIVTKGDVAAAFEHLVSY